MNRFGGSGVGGGSGGGCGRMFKLRECIALVRGGSGRLLVMRR